MAQDSQISRAHMGLAYLALLFLCTCVFIWTAPGRITYPDDEIVFQTTQSLYVDHDLTIDGIAKRTGERGDRPSGTFGWAAGRNAQRYGFFGHGLSVVALPLYALADATTERVPALWRHAIRSDLFTFHTRGHAADWQRMLVSLTDCLLTPLGAMLLAVWLRVLGHGPRVAIGCALIYAFATTAWPYAGTFLSEPLSVVVLLGAAIEFSRWRRDQRPRDLWIAASLAGLSVHVHLLNLLAIPWLFAYGLGLGERAWAGLRDAWRTHRREWWIAALLAGLGLALLGLSHWWRFGSPFETGRRDHYGFWVWPFEGVLTMLVAPGRSLLLYSPPLLLSLWAWPALRRRDAATASLILGLSLTRLVFVACRSDWHGGWAIGPRYLIPLVPFLLVPLAGWLEGWSTRPRAHRALALAGLGASVLLQAWLAVHAVFQVFWKLNVEHGRERYLWYADWQLASMPPIAFWQQQQTAIGYWREGNLRAAINSAQFDCLGFGAWRLAKLTPADGLWTLMLGIAGIGLLAGVALTWWWRAHSPNASPNASR